MNANPNITSDVSSGTSAVRVGAGAGCFLNQKRRQHQYHQRTVLRSGCEILHKRPKPDTRMLKTATIRIAPAAM
jgi:hypothetical protein